MSKWPQNNSNTVWISSPLCTWAAPQRLVQKAAPVKSGSGAPGLAASSSPVSAEVMEAEEQRVDLRPQVLPARRQEAWLHSERWANTGRWLAPVPVLPFNAWLLKHNRLTCVLTDITWHGYTYFHQLVAYNVVGLKIVFISKQRHFNKLI